MKCQIGIEQVADGEDVKVIEVDNYPNPWNPATTVRIAIPAQRMEERYLLNIYNIKGQLVRTLVKGTVGKTGLVRRVSWDGTDNLGTMVGAGIYYYRLNVGDKIRKGSMVFAK
jgi:flagellar hook assembly protein FlgD